MQHLHFIPIPSPLQINPFDLTSTILDCLKNEEISLQTGDIVIVSSKFAAVAEGRTVRLREVIPTPEAEALARRFNMSPSLAQLILQESTEVLGGVSGYVLAIRDQLIIPNAGIDASNVPEGYVVLYPQNPFATARRLRAEVREKRNIDIGVIITDSALMPTREGTTGVAIGVAGFHPVEDDRGKSDLVGKPLQVSRRAIADNLCSAAELLMGEAADGIPIVIARSSNLPLTEEDYTSSDLAIAPSADIYTALIRSTS